VVVLVVKKSAHATLLPRKPPEMVVLVVEALASQIPLEMLTAALGLKIEVRQSLVALVANTQRSRLHPIPQILAPEEVPWSQLKLS